MSVQASLGTIIKRVRKERRWTLAEMSDKCGIPLSTLSKIENDKLTLAYDRLLQLSRAVGIPLGELFAEPDSDHVEADPDAAEGQPGGSVITARRSIATLASAVRVETPNYTYNYLCSDLRKHRMIPIHVQITARSLPEFGELVRHIGEEFAWVIEGAVTLHTEFYGPVTLRKGEGVYIDSNMGHAYLVADGFEQATILSVCASADDNLQEHLMAEAESRHEPASVAA